MCGRYTMTTSSEDVASLFETGSPPPFGPRYNIAPSQEALIVTGEEGGARSSRLAGWGFPLAPSGGKAGRLVINARSEDVEHRPLFREAFRRRRCLVPASGFFEWTKIGRVKQPWYFSVPESPLFAFAGLWESDSEGKVRYVILTTEANSVVAEAHDRMPVILNPQQRRRWTDQRALSEASTEEIFKPWPAEMTVSRAVGLKVNDPSYDEPACIRPLEGPVDLFTY